MANKPKESKKIRDLIRIGIFTALWIAVGWIIACTIGFFPPILVILPCILAVAGSVIYVVLLSKMNTRGGIFIPSFIFGSLRDVVYLHIYRRSSWRNYL